MKLYTSVSSGGKYELLGRSKGAGELRGEVLVVYRCVNTGQIYHRTCEDFEERMEEI